LLFFYFFSRKTLNYVLSLSHTSKEFQIKFLSLPTSKLKRNLTSSVKINKINWFINNYLIHSLWKFSNSWSSFYYNSYWWNKILENYINHILKSHLKVKVIGLSWFFDMVSEHWWPIVTSLNLTIPIWVMWVCASFKSKEFSFEEVC
jgi:hypothetical protein